MQITSVFGPTDHSATSAQVILISMKLKELIPMELKGMLKPSPVFFLLYNPHVHHLSFLELNSLQLLKLYAVRKKRRENNGKMYTCSTKVVTLHSNIPHVTMPVHNHFICTLSENTVTLYKVPSQNIKGTYR